jgi:hypothetical protein
MSVHFCDDWLAIINDNRWRQKDSLRKQALLFLDQIKREKGVWWMPWQ